MGIGGRCKQQNRLIDVVIERIETKATDWLMHTTFQVVSACGSTKAPVITGL